MPIYTEALKTQIVHACPNVCGEAPQGALKDVSVKCPRCGSEMFARQASTLSSGFTWSAARSKWVHLDLASLSDYGTSDPFGEGELVYKVFGQGGLSLNPFAPESDGWHIWTDGFLAAQNWEELDFEDTFNSGVWSCRG